MTDTFEDIGIASRLTAGAEALGWDAPTGLQRDALPVVRRGNNVVLHASAGSGLVGAWGLGLLDRLIDADAPDAAPRLLVLVPDSGSASLTAASLARLAGPADIAVRALAPGWPDRDADILVASPTAAMGAVRASRLKLDGLLALVIDAADQMDALGQWEDIETLVDIVPSGAQRVVCAGELDERVDGFLDRHVRRAMTIPPRPADQEEPGPSGGSVVGYTVVPEHRKPATLVHLLRSADADGVAVVCRSHDRADALRSDLAARGVTDTGEGRLLVLPRLEADQRTTRAHVISADVPFDAEGLAELHGKGGGVLVTPRERAHLLRIARRAGIPLKALPDAGPSGTDRAEAVRDRIRALLADQDLAADLALVEPLLDEFPAAEVAAAALYLAREAAPAAAGPGARVAAPAAGAATAPPPSTTTWVHLFISAGTRDGITPGDVVGAITGEAGVPGDSVGKIDIRESHTTAEVATGVADQVIQSLNGRTLKGRSLRVDYDRKGSSGPSRGGPSRGGSRGGPPRGGPSRGGARGGGGRGGARGPGGRSPRGRRPQ
jgi:ATP-dependent RNA helicase DeaD